MLTLDGNVMLTERDEFIYDEMITHVPMSVHRSAKDILVIGAGDGGVVRELTQKIACCCQEEQGEKQIHGKYQENQKVWRMDLDSLMYGMHRGESSIIY